jgi:hypothetical protein
MESGREAVNYREFVFESKIVGEIGHMNTIEVERLA